MTADLRPPGPEPAEPEPSRPQRVGTPPIDAAVNRVSALSFVVGFGLVSALGDVVYEGARSIIGPFLGQLGASAVQVGLITGTGEAVALVLRLFTGRLIDRTGKPWPQTIAGYALTMACVPLIALAHGLWAAGLLYNGERFGQAPLLRGRSPVR